MWSPGVPLLCGCVRPCFRVFLVLCSRNPVLPLSGLDVFGVSGWFLFVGASFDDEDVWGRGLAPACRVNCFDAVVALSTGTSDVTWFAGYTCCPHNSPGEVVWSGRGLKWYVMVRRWSETTLSDRFDTFRRSLWSGCGGFGQWEVSFEE